MPAPVDTANVSEYKFRQVNDGELTLMDDWKRAKRRWFGFRMIYVADRGTKTSNSKRSEG